MICVYSPHRLITYKWYLMSYGWAHLDTTSYFDNISIRWQFFHFCNNKIVRVTDMNLDSHSTLWVYLQLLFFNNLLRWLTKYLYQVLSFWVSVLLSYFHYVSSLIRSSLVSEGSKKYTLTSISDTWWIDHGKPTC